MTDSSQQIDINGGVHCADFVGRDQTNHYGFSAADVEHLIERVLAFAQAGAVFQPAPDEPDAYFAELDGQKLSFQPGAARHLAGMRSLRAYLLALAVDQEYQRWASRFVPLAGKMDLLQAIEGVPVSFTELVPPSGEGGQVTHKKLESIAEAMQTHGAFIILGEPGAGKTTTQQRIAYDAACALLENHPGRVPLFVRLSQQGERDPYSFLQTEWERRTGLPFDESLSAGRILILADGVNEIAREKRNERLKAWMLFEQEYRGANRLIFSGREKDYYQQLNLPRVLVEPLDDARIDDFLERHKAGELRALLDAPQNRLREMATNPLHLFVLTMVYLQGGRSLQTLTNSGKLFATFSDWLLRHEQKWHPDDLSVDGKVDLFACLAYEMQKHGSGTTIALADAKNSLPASVILLGEELPLDPLALFRFGRGASILDPATLPDVRFYHHLLQEYFAARELLRRFNSGETLSHLWKTPRRVDEMPTADVGEWDPLPEPPVSGWEVTTILACGLSHTPEKLIEAVRLINPILASSCLYSSGVGNFPKITQDVQNDLIANISNLQLNLRIRLKSAINLGYLGDCRFESQEISKIKLIIPQMVYIPDDVYFIGANSHDSNASPNEGPNFVKKLQAFSISKWPITNQEFKFFIMAGGYEDTSNWQTAISKNWLINKKFKGGQFKSWLNIWKHLKSNSNWRDEYEKQKKIPPNSLRYYDHIVTLSEEEFIDELASISTKKSRKKPHFWDEELFNNPSQPVVGITWFEAVAYCSWLSRITQDRYRLPTEFEWEASMRGKGENIYPWGDNWIDHIANTVECRIWRPAPVGLFTPNGCVNGLGIEEPVGNVWNWTSSLYKYYPYEEIYKDGESPDERVLRGGSWSSNKYLARISTRVRDAPEYYDKNIGFRVLREEDTSNSVEQS